MLTIPPHLGTFITFEGCECCGKTTQSKLLYEWLHSQGKEAVLTKEPGGTKAGEQIRELLLDKEVGLTTESELLLHVTSRREHVESVILPALNEKKVVVCDRFADSTIAYQCYGHKLPLSLARLLHKKFIENLQPSITFIFDITFATFRKRLKEKHAKNGSNDRYETFPEDFHKRVIKGFRKIAKTSPERCILINADKRSIQEIHQEVLRQLQKLSLL